jgi:hypothetical protein
MKSTIIEKRLSLGCVLVVFTLWGPVPPQFEVNAASRETSDASFPAYPVKVSANRRYLVDQNNTPFLIAGDSLQGLIYRLSEAQAEN